MNNLYNQNDVDGILQRLQNLQSDSPRQWGKMNVDQMLAHLNVALETAMGLRSQKRAFIGRIFGPLVKGKFLKPTPMDKNGPTAKEYIITESKDFDEEKAKAINLVETFYKNGPEKCTKDPHPFFGKFTPEEWAILQWKHFDHHLKQFGN